MGYWGRYYDINRGGKHTPTPAHPPSSPTQAPFLSEPHSRGASRPSIKWDPTVDIQNWGPHWSRTWGAQPIRARRWAAVLLSPTVFKCPPRLRRRRSSPQPRRTPPFSAAISIPVVFVLCSSRRCLLRLTRPPPPRRSLRPKPRLPSPPPMRRPRRPAPPRRRARRPPRRRSRRRLRHRRSPALLPPILPILR